MASIVDKIVTNLSIGIEKVIQFFRFFASSSEESEITVNTDSGSEGLDEVDHQPEPTSESPVAGTFLNITEVLSPEESDILPGSTSGNNTSFVDPSLFSVAVAANQSSEISAIVSDF